MRAAGPTATLLTAHARPLQIDAAGALALPALTPGATPDSWVEEAGRSVHLLPAMVRDALAMFAVESDRSGALLLRGMPVGDTPVTPASPTAPTGKDLVSEATLLRVARSLGEPVG